MTINTQIFLGQSCVIFCTAWFIFPSLISHAANFACCCIDGCRSIFCILALQRLLPAAGDTLRDRALSGQCRIRDLRRHQELARRTGCPEPECCSGCRQLRRDLPGYVAPAAEGLRRQLPIDLSWRKGWPFYHVAAFRHAKGLRSTHASLV